MVYQNVLEALGHTPMIRLNRMAEPDCADIYVKFEGLNVGGSIKTRTAFRMIEEAEKLLGRSASNIKCVHEDRLDMRNWQERRMRLVTVPWRWLHAMDLHCWMKKITVPCRNLAILI